MLGTRPRACASGATVCSQRSIGEQTISASGTPASRSTSFSAWARPVSSSSTPGVRPASTPVALAADRPWRSRISVVTTARAYVVGQTAESQPAPKATNSTAPSATRYQTNR